MKNILILFIAMACFSACTQPAQAPEVVGDYSIASDEYVDIAKKANDLLSAYDFDAWGELLADDVEYNFPDGTPETRTSLKGKEAVLGWWKSWKETSGIKTFTLKDGNYVPISTTKEQTTTGMAGTYVLSWVTTVLEFENGNTAAFRMSNPVHFNDEKKIDRFYSYYDRTGIIQAMGGNILEPPSEENAAEETE